MESEFQAPKFKSRSLSTASGHHTSLRCPQPLEFGGTLCQPSRSVSLLLTLLSIQGPVFSALPVSSQALLVQGAQQEPVFLP